MTVLLHDVDLDGERVDVRLDGARIAAIGPIGGLAPAGDEERIDAGGGAVLPGLHDHHLHLLATAAAARSVDLSAQAIDGPEGLARALAGAPIGPTGWVRAVGYHESQAGPLDRHVLDRAGSVAPLRVQDASGARWTLDTLGLRAIGIDPGAAATDLPSGVELDDAGRPTGVVHRADAWLRDRLPAEGPPSLAALGARLAAVGITGVTDATPVDDPSSWHVLAAAVAAGELPVEVVVTGSPALAATVPPVPLGRGPCKVIVDDADLPAVEDLAAAFRAAHGAGRNVAVHCVTGAALALALAAWDEAGVRAGDRIEHGSVISPGAVDVIAGHGLLVVTQPGLVGERGRRYLREVAPDDVGDLYRCGSLVAAGIGVAAGSDAPYTDVDPWAAVRAAVSRRSGDVVVGPGEALAPEAALGLYQGTAGDPTARRTVAVGAPADLVVAALPWRELRHDLASEQIVATIAGGRVAHRRT